MKKNLVERVVLLFQNSESIEGSVLSDLVDVLSSVGSMPRMIFA